MNKSTFLRGPIMSKSKSPKTISLYARRKLLPIVNAGKYVGFLGSLFFQQENTQVFFLFFVFLTLMFLTTDTYLKLVLWKCPHCSKTLPHDFYSRKTMTTCPNCQKELDFSDTRLWISASSVAEVSNVEEVNN